MTDSTGHVPNTIAMSMLRAQEHFKRRAKEIWYRSHPVEWVQDRIEGHLWSKQRDIMESLVHNKKTAVKSGHGVGKTDIAAKAVMWWIESHLSELGDTMVVTTAPTYDQVQGVLWEYIRKTHAQFGLIGTVSEQTQWKSDDRAIIGIGRKPADGATSSFQGRHYKYTLIVIDEACGILPDLFTAVDAIATTDTCRVLAIGNPTDPNTTFGNIFLGNGGRGLPNWNKMTISVLENPNFTDEEFPAEIKEKLSSQKWLEEKKAEVGEDSNDYKSRVLGEFPESSDDNMFPLHLLYKGRNTIIVPRDYTRPELGVDIARFGSDSSSCVRYHDGDTSVERVWRGADSIQSAQIIHEIAVRTNASKVKIDAVGVGAGVVDQLRVLCLNHDYTVWEMQGAGMTPDPKKYLNARAWWHANVHDMLHRGELHLPVTTGNAHAERLFEEMWSIKKKYNVTYGSLQIESKDDMKKRGVKSPDISDALMYACAPVGDETDPLAPYGVGDTFVYDPFDDPDLFEGRNYVISPM
jgi:hypothetical protein